MRVRALQPRYTFLFVLDTPGAGEAGLDKGWLDTPPTTIYDYSFGNGSANFLVDSSAAVAQDIFTALKLWAGEWFLDDTAGVPYLTSVLGFTTGGTYDASLRAAILGVQGVTSLLSYSSVLNTATRVLTVAATVLTAYSATPVSVNAPINIQVPNP